MITDLLAEDKHPESNGKQDSRGWRKGKTLGEVTNSEGEINKNKLCSSLPTPPSSFSLLSSVFARVFAYNVNL